MRKNLYVLILLLSFTFNLSAQPTLHQMRFQTVGDSTKYLLYDTSNIFWTSGGNNQVWTYTLNKIIDSETFTVVLPTNTPFSDLPASNIAVRHIHAGIAEYHYYNQKIDSTFLLGIRIPLINGYSNDSVPELTSIRPFIPSINFIDTFRDDFGTGTKEISYDGYGRLVINNQIYENVVRVKEFKVVNDTIPKNSLNYVTFTNLTYSWFNEDYTDAILIVDSSKASNDRKFYKKVMYLQKAATKINDLKPALANLSVSLPGNYLIVTADFKNNTEYNIVLFDFIGRKRFASTFFTEEKTKRFEINNIETGFYTILISERQNPSVFCSIKTCKY